MLYPLNGTKSAKMNAKLGVKNTKSTILRTIFHLEHCKSTNGLKKWLCKQKIPKMYFLRHRWVVGALKSAKRAKFGQNEGQKYKIVNFETNFPFGTL